MASCKALINLQEIKKARGKILRVSAKKQREIEMFEKIFEFT